MTQSAVTLLQCIGKKIRLPKKKEEETTAVDLLVTLLNIAYVAWI